MNKNNINKTKFITPYLEIIDFDTPIYTTDVIGGSVAGDNNIYFDEI